MEAFSLLKFWRITPADDVSGSGGGDPFGTTSITDDGCVRAVETDDEADDDEDSFFDLEFAVPGGDSCNDLARKGSNFVESNNDVFLGGRFSPLEESNSKPQSPISFLRSPPKFRVFMLFKKPKLEKTEATNASPATPNRFAVKCDVEEVPIWSLLTRVNSAKTKSQSHRSEEAAASTKRFPKDAVQKYLKLIKPLYVRASKRYTGNLKLSEKVSAADPTASPAAVRSPSKKAEEKQGSRAPPLRVVCKQLGKSRSASASASGILPLPSSKRDDSLVQQHDGIQSAILHCKRSYNSSRDLSLRSRFASETFNEITVNPRVPTEEEEEEEEKKRSSI